MKRIPLFALIILWILLLFFRPIEDLPFTYFTGLVDALASGKNVLILLFALPIVALAALTWTYIQYIAAPNAGSKRVVLMLARIGLILNILYSLVIWAMDGIYSGIMHFSRESAKSHWGVDVNEEVVDEIALIFYWFNWVVPLLYYLFIYFFKRNRTS